MMRYASTIIAIVLTTSLTGFVERVKKNNDIENQDDLAIASSALQWCYTRLSTTMSVSASLHNIHKAYRFMGNLPFG